MKLDTAAKRLKLVGITGVITILVLLVFFVGKNAFSKSGTEITTPSLMMTGTKLPPTEVTTAPLVMTGTKLPPTEVTTATLVMTGTKLPPTEVTTAKLMMTGVKVSMEMDKISLPQDPKGKKKIKAKPIEMTGMRKLMKIKWVPEEGLEKKDEYERSDEFEDEMIEDQTWPAAGEMRREKTR